MMDGKQGTSSNKSAAIDSESTKQSERAPASASKPKARNPSTDGEKQTDSIYDHFDKNSFCFWEREISKGHLPTSAELTELLKKNSGSPVPDWLVPIIERRDELRWRTGRPPKSVFNEMRKPPQGTPATSLGCGRAIAAWVFRVGLPFAVKIGGPVHRMNARREWRYGAPGLGT